MTPVTLRDRHVSCPAASHGSQVPRGRGHPREARLTACGGEQRRLPQRRAAQAANYHCNATCCLLLTHHFTRKMLDNKQTGLVAFTSSSAGFLPNPMSILYPSTKA